MERMSPDLHPKGGQESSLPYRGKSWKGGLRTSFLREDRGPPSHTGTILWKGGLPTSFLREDRSPPSHTEANHGKDVSRPPSQGRTGVLPPILRQIMERRSPDLLPKGGQESSLPNSILKLYIMFFDPNEEVQINTSGILPHWHQDGKMQYVTFRLADSLPKSVCQDLHERVSQFKKTHPEPWDEIVKQLYWKEIGPMQHRLLDNGYGSCILRNRECRKVLVDTIAYRDDIDYKVISYVIMPNHVHMLILPLAKCKLNYILNSIKKFSAKKINHIIGKTGPLWMKESFDRIVRNEDSYKHYYNYIIANPRYLSPSDYTLYLR